MEYYAEVEKELAEKPYVMIIDSNSTQRRYFFPSTVMKDPFSPYEKAVLKNIDSRSKKNNLIEQINSMFLRRILLSIYVIKGISSIEIFPRTLVVERQKQFCWEIIETSLHLELKKFFPVEIQEKVVFI